MTVTTVIRSVKVNSVAIARAHSCWSTAIITGNQGTCSTTKRWRSKPPTMARGGMMLRQQQQYDVLHRRAWGQRSPLCVPECRARWLAMEMLDVGLLFSLRGICVKNTALPSETGGGCGCTLYVRSPALLVNLSMCSPQPVRAVRALIEG